MTSTPITQMIKLRKKLRSRETTQQVITTTPAHTHTKVPEQAEETCSSEGTGDPWQWEVIVVRAGLTGHLVWGCPVPGTAPPSPQGPQADVVIHKCSLSPSQDSALHPSLPAAADTWLSGSPASLTILPRGPPPTPCPRSVMAFLLPIAAAKGLCSHVPQTHQLLPS